MGCIIGICKNRYTKQALAFSDIYSHQKHSERAFKRRNIENTIAFRKIKH